MKIAGKFATATLAATLTSTALADDFYTLFPAIVELEKQALESRIILNPKVRPSESDVRPDIKFYTHLDLTDPSQTFFNEFMMGRSWTEQDYARLADDTSHSSPLIAYTVAPISNTSGVSLYGEDILGTREASSVPSRGALALFGLGVLWAAQRARK